MSALQDFFEYAEDLRYQVEGEFLINQQEREQSRQEFSQHVAAVRAELAEEREEDEGGAGYHVDDPSGGRISYYDAAPWAAAHLRERARSL